jgi:3-deoxy-D-manno-octulosonic acid kinase
MSEGGQRIATATGVMLADPNGLGNEHLSAGESLFDPNFWSARGELAAVSTGRGSAWFVGAAPHRWVLRHYRRGGLVANISQDRYLWAEEDRVRAFAEWRLLQQLSQRGLNVPKPVAAFYRRSGLTYRCDLITQRIEHAEPLSAAILTAPVVPRVWSAVGAAVAQLHRFGVDHADLNAHNILLADGAVTVIDFDRSRFRAPQGSGGPEGPRAPAGWAAANLARLQHSLGKISVALPPDRFTAANWNEFLAGYRAGSGKPGD